jgi:hypothetical protein
MTAARADAWRARGAYFSWSPSGENAAPVEVFHVELGDSEAPVLALVFRHAALTGSRSLNG